MAAGKKEPDEPRAEVDLSTIRYLLTLTPEERVRLAAEEARNLRRFDLEVEKSAGGARRTCLPPRPPRSLARRSG